MSALRRLRDGRRARDPLPALDLRDRQEQVHRRLSPRAQRDRGLLRRATTQIGAAEHGRLAEPGATPDAAVEGKLAIDNLRGAFGGLSPVHHDILVMREFEGLSYREIGERLGMSRPAVESTLFRARKRLGEEYEELVSGKRCLRVQRIVEAPAARAAGLRDQRRVARHLAHCQPCRRYARVARASTSARAAAAGGGRRADRRVPAAAGVPAPALGRRGGGRRCLGQAAGRSAHWSAHVADALDPGTVSGWAKVAATAATVAVAGVGAGGDRASRAGRRGSARQRPRRRAGAGARSSAAPRRVAPGAPLPARRATATVARGARGRRASAATRRARRAAAPRAGAPSAGPAPAAPAPVGGAAAHGASRGAAPAPARAARWRRCSTRVGLGRGADARWPEPRPSGQPRSARRGCSAARAPARAPPSDRGAAAPRTAVVAR